MQNYGDQTCSWASLKLNSDQLPCNRKVNWVHTAQCITEIYPHLIYSAKERLTRLLLYAALSCLMQTLCKISCIVLWRANTKGHHRKKRQGARPKNTTATPVIGFNFPMWWWTQMATDKSVYSETQFGTIVYNQTLQWALPMPSKSMKAACYPTRGS